MRALLLTLFISLLLIMPTFGEGVQEVVYEEIQQQESTEEELQVEGTEEELTQQKNLEMEVKEVNYTLSFRELGFYKDEYKDEELNMRNAILRFQSNNNIIVDGELSEETKLVFNYSITAQEELINDHIEKAPTDKKWIVINKTKRILTLYEGTKVIKKYPVAQGKLPSYTPVGKFTIVNKAIDPAWGGAGIYKPVKGGVPENPLGPRWMGLSIKGGGSYGIHGNNNPYSIGTNASLGCVRMINSDVKELYELIQKNTIVWIGTDEKLQEWGVYQESYLSKIQI